MFNADEGQFAERFILVNDEFELVTTADEIEELVPFSLREVDDIDDWLDTEDWDSDDDEDWVEHQRLPSSHKDSEH